MKRFIIKIIWLFFPILMVALGMEILMRNIPNDYLLKNQYLENHSPEIETLILGSSHSFYGFNPEYFSGKTFNASYISQPLKYDYKILEKFQGKFDNLKTIVLPISYFTLFSKLEADSEAWRVKNYIIYYKMKISSKSLSDYSEFLGNRKNVGIKRLVLYYILGKSQVTCTESGWVARYKSKNARNLTETGKIASIRHTKDNIYSDKYQKRYKDNIETIKNIIKWSENYNIRIMFVTPPAFETYRKNLNAVQLNTTVKTIKEISSKSENCTYINLLDDPNFIEEDYYDADHMSEIGAKKLSMLINNKINE